jgi:glycosyltransferase involved in cell wall biosynthesis
MKILFVSLSGSIHTARWISQIEDKNWDLYLFPSYDNFWINDDLISVNYCIPNWWIYQFSLKFNAGNIFRIIYKIFAAFLFFLDKKYYEKRLLKYIKKIKPDIIHSMETQGGGYLVDSVKLNYYKTSNFPVWWHANWGSDMYIFGRIDEHKNRIKSVLSNCDYYSCECQRDVRLALEFGFKNEVLSVYPNSGGINMQLIDEVYANADLTASRKIIMLKGYQGWAGRALVGLRALTRCKEILSGYTVVIYTNTNAEDIKVASSLFMNDTGIRVILLKEHSDYLTILSYHAKARISIGLSIGDAISTSMLEAMSVGSFPIQSNTSCADEWIEDGVSGFIVPPEDPEFVELAIRRAILDDNLVNKAAEINKTKIREEISFDNLKIKTIDTYLNLHKKNRYG